jgi:capsular exopolysaccharide synthesis family protein
MSRVDEALRRARELAVAPSLGDTQRHEAPIGRRDAHGMDLYPTEEASAVNPPTPTPEPLRPMSVPRPAEAPAAAGAVSRRTGRAYEGKLVRGQGMSPAPVEQYQRLAAALHHLQCEQGLNRVMVSSAVPQEGKTLTIVNLALTLSSSYKRRVLLIDADLRRPSIHDVFAIANDGGLYEAIHGEAAGQPRYMQVSPQLWVLPAGSPAGSPMASLTSDRMSRFLDDMAKQFDWILLDAPPVALMADAGMLVRLTRAVVLVIAAGATPYTVVEKVVGELGREHIVGVVLNRVDDEAAEWSPYYAGTPHQPQS